ncbi:hypothetical protein POL68_01185 [Stigmatella sp. ncwal1]|uniref:Transposase n=1 Tax=Stigmatella ashevillensis TaxID=2995309 RepID=A0ABT5D2I1_9BACT|nr:hypothetical protein [Stigmatella ashevillena]MDC0707073.1 hypothetical protein [Stigmatella ashevillena]
MFLRDLLHWALTCLGMVLDLKGLRALVDSGALKQLPADGRPGGEGTDSDLFDAQQK